MSQNEKKQIKKEISSRTKKYFCWKFGKWRDQRNEAKQSLVN